MVKFLALQVRLGKITIEEIPERYRADVVKAFEVDTYENH